MLTHLPPALCVCEDQIHFPFSFFFFSNVGFYTWEVSVSHLGLLRGTQGNPNTWYVAWLHRPSCSSCICMQQLGCWWLFECGGVLKIWLESLTFGGPVCIYDIQYREKASFGVRSQWKAPWSLRQKEAGPLTYIVHRPFAVRRNFFSFQTEGTSTLIA